MSNDEAVRSVNQPRFVGRAEERRQLTRFIASTRGGRGGVVLLTGEAGVGKTRLLLDLTDPKRREEVVLLRGRATSSGVAQSFLSPVVDSLRSARFQPELGVWAALEPRARWLSPALPELLPDSQAQAAFDCELLFEHLLDAVCEAARDLPTVWLLDDLQWADGATWAFLRHASRRAPLARLALLAACRDDEVGAGHPARAELVGLGQDPEVLRIELDRLAAPETERLVRSVAGSRLETDAISRLVQRSGGNPRAAADLAAAALSNGSAQVPASISLTVDQRAATLGSDARDLLETLAVIGVEAELALVVQLRAAAELSLGHLVECGLVTNGGTSQEMSVSFRHPLFRDAVYEKTPWTRRRLLHAQVADALESAAGGAEAMALGAHHRELSGDAEGAVRALTAGAESARAALDLRRAGDLFLAALAAATRDSRLAHHRPALVWAAIEQLDAAGRWAELLPLAWQAWQLPLAEMSVPAAELSRVLGSALLMMGRVEEGYGLLATEADHAVRSGETGSARRLMATAATAANYLGDPPRARRLAEIARSSGRDGADVLVDCVTIAQRFHRHRKREASARAFHANGVRALRQGMLREAAVAFWNHARMTVQLPDVLNAESVGDRARSMIGVLSRLLLGAIQTLEGRPAQAARTFSRVDSEVRAVAPLLAPLLDGFRAQLHLQQGELVRARRLIKRWDGEHSEVRSASLTVLEAARGWLAWETGDLDEAAARLRRCAEDSSATGYGLFESGPLLLPIHVDALLRLGRDEEAERLIEATANGADFDRFFSAAVAAACFRRQPSRVAGEEAQRAAAGAPWPFLEGVVESWRAQLVGDVAADRRARMRFPVTSGQAAAPGELSAGEVTEVGPAQVEAAPSHNMSRRELQIAGLIAEGLTNRAMAAQLVLSPETVSTHVKHILAKLGFNSRSQVAAWLSEQRTRSQETETLLRSAGTKIPHMGDSRRG